MNTAEAALVNSTDYEVRAVSVIPYDENYLIETGPLVMIIDSGIESLVTQDQDNIRYSVQVDFHAYAKGESFSDAQAKVNGLVDAIRAWINSGPSLGSNVLSFKFVEGTDTIIDGDDYKLRSVLRTRIVYYVAKSTSEASGTDDYGTGWIPTARDKVYDLIDTLKSIVSSYSPTYSHVYKQHQIANLALNAFSVDLDSVVSNEGNRAFDSSQQTSVVYYFVNLSVRCHTAYVDEHFDSQKTLHLLNGAVNYIKENEDLGDGYRVIDLTDVVTNQRYDDSGTLGGEFMVSVGKEISH
ncbi:hypothetical protein GF420_11530 [candidate division GN15 bacterium]|nr:hypothetical protein [candidate division GN15 bacterium]